VLIPVGILACWYKAGTIFLAFLLRSSQNHKKIEPSNSSWPSKPVSFEGLFVGSWRVISMSILRRATALSLPRLANQALASLLALLLLFAAYPQNVAAYQDLQAAPEPTQGSQYVQQPPEELQRLVAPIALYPDSLVAQILAASTFPEQVVEADRWSQAHPDLKGDALGQAVDQEAWDPSVKALTAFPSVLGNMDKNLSWTSSLGDAYFNQQQDVMAAVQVMRRRAQDSGSLKSTSQQNVTTEGPDIEIVPADPQIVYVPAYDPWVIYGDPILAWPGWYPYPGIWFDGPFLSFGIGFGIGFYGGYGWGWGNWGFDWHNHYAVYNHGRYYSGSRNFYNRNAFYRGGDRGGRGAEPFGGNRGAARGFGDARGQSGTRSGSFSGFGRGGDERSFSSRGSSSFGGGGGFHGGGGGGGRHR
jgi:uncharacterized membrane protein YgcG